MLKLITNILSLKAGGALPISAAIDLTDRCNFHCRFCGIWAKQNKSDLDPQIFKAQFEKSKALKNLKIFNFGGGEPFLLNDLGYFVETVIRYARPLQIRFVTNGYLTGRIYNTMQDLLQRFRVPFGVKISIDGLRDMHNELRGLSDAFEKTMETLDALLNLRRNYRRKLSLNLGFTVTSANYRQLQAVFNLCIKKRVGFFYKPVLNADKFCQANFDNSLLLNKEQTFEVVRFGKFILKNLKGFPLKERVIYRLYYRLQNKSLAAETTQARLIPCYAACASFYMTPDGNVSPCFMRNEIMGNINNTEFDDFWFSNSAELLRKKLKSSDCFCLTSCDTFPSLLVHKFPFYF
jgi:MoaA/NifB/PqqE/SkfB family radical SAM enzyme